MSLSLSLFMFFVFTFFLLAEKLSLHRNLQVPLHHLAVLKLQFSQPTSSNQSINRAYFEWEKQQPSWGKSCTILRKAIKYISNKMRSKWLVRIVIVSMQHENILSGFFFFSLSNLSKSHFRPRNTNRDRERDTHTISNNTTNDMKNLSNFKYTIKIMQHSISITMLSMLKKRNHIDTNCSKHIRFEMICTIRIPMM